MQNTVLQQQSGKGLTAVPGVSSELEEEVQSNIDWAWLQARPLPHHPNLPQNTQNPFSPYKMAGVPVQGLPFHMPNGVNFSPGPSHATHFSKAALGLIMMCSLQNNTQACHATLQKDLSLLTQP